MPLITLPEHKDINEFFLLTAHAKEQFEQSAHRQRTPNSKQLKKKRDPDPTDREQTTITADTITCTREKRFYEVRGISKTGNKLKATVKGICNKRFHVDTVDFYSARSRSYLVRGLAELFGEEEKTISRDMEKLTLLAEEYTAQSRCGYRSTRGNPCKRERRSHALSQEPEPAGRDRLPISRRSATPARR